jgi:hypothetical protein
MGKKKSKKSSNNNNSNNNNANGEGLILIDPARIRFQHARIRPYFSGCGRSLVATLDEIREGRLKPSDLPPIQVLVGPDDWYFSLNNRRLWVLKRCREEGLLLLENNNNQIAVRVRKPKSDQEALRYSLENCALEAKIMPEKNSNNNNNKDDKAAGNPTNDESKQESEDTAIIKETETTSAMSELEKLSLSDAPNVLEEESDDDESSEDEGPTSSNRFSALF